jgi:hypothetical protein
MARGPRNIKITRQQKHILLLALFLLRHEHNQPRPEKRQVLNYIRLHNLIHLRDEDRQRISASEESWENDISWRREDLKAEGFLTMPEIGIWQITPDGEHHISRWCALMRYFTLATPDWPERLDLLETVFDEKIVITCDTVLEAIQAYDIAVRVFHPESTTVPDEFKGKWSF